MNILSSPRTAHVIRASMQQFFYQTKFEIQQVSKVISLIYNFVMYLNQDFWIVNKRRNLKTTDYVAVDVSNLAKLLEFLLRFI